MNHAHLIAEQTQDAAKRLHAFLTAYGAYPTKIRQPLMMVELSLRAVARDAAVYPQVPESAYWPAWATHVLDCARRIVSSVHQTQCFQGEALSDLVTALDLLSDLE